jgi:hypothetical protein
LDDRRTLSRDAFLEKHPHPVLVIALNPEGGALEDDGAFRTQVVTSESERSPLAYALRHSAVVPIEKRMPDAFQAFIWVGRESRCDVSLPFESVSKLQAQFVKRASGDFELSDAGSTNGTFVDGTRLEKNKPVLLRDSVRLRFGKIDARFRSPDGFWEELGRFL